MAPATRRGELQNDDYLSFKQFMSEIPSGKIDGANISRDIESNLSEVWPLLDSVREGGMEDYKLHGRMESIVWNPPLLSFVNTQNVGLPLFFAPHIKFALAARP